MNFTLRQLELFSVLPDHPTLASAAASLHISESALSHAITELEKSIGEQLCVRRKARGLSLTPAGQFFASRARRLLKDANELVSELSNRQGHLKGPVSLGCYTGLASTVVPPIFEEFARRHPDVTLDVTVGNQADFFPALQRGQLDLAIVYDTMLPPGLAKRVVYETEVMAVLPQGHGLVDREVVDLADLAPEPLIMLESSPSTDHTYRLFREQGLTPELFTTAPVIELVRALVGRGLGYSLLMSRPSSSDMTTEGRRIVERPLAHRSVTTVVAVWPAHMTLTPRAEEVVRYAATQAFGDRPDHAPVVEGA